MEIVIKIDDEVYKNAKSINWANMRPEVVDDWEYIVASGTPLPKGHGDLVDISPYKGKVICSHLYSGVKKLIEVDSIEPIIKADKGGEDEISN